MIVDDEQHCIDTLAAIIKAKFAARLTVTNTSRNAKLAIEQLKKSPPDILFLDVEMPGYNGLQLLSEFSERSFEVVFTTAYDRYALGALKEEAIDYLLKPISVSELQTAIEKCERKIHEKQIAAAIPSAKKLVLPSAQGALLANLNDIIRFESSNNYCTVYFTNRPKLVVAKTLKVFDDQLQNDGFFRVHQSHLINMRSAQTYENGEPSYVVLSNGEKIEIARRRKSDFLKLMGR